MVFRPNGTLPKVGIYIAGVPGLEPRMAVPETAVLPITPYPTGFEASPNRGLTLPDQHRRSQTGHHFAGHARTASRRAMVRAWPNSSNDSCLLYTSDAADEED